MPRQARIVIPNIAHHIIQRGNYRQEIFTEQEHYRQYCEWMDEYAQKNRLSVVAFCLMNNHVHFIVIPEKEKDLSETFKIVHMRFSHFVNRQRSVKGHLWQGRFFSCLLDDTHLYRAIRYVENNPVKGGIVKKAWEYEWSSAKDHVKERTKALIKLSKHKDMNLGEEWREYLLEDDPELTKDIRIKTEQGLVVGSAGFIKKLEGVLNRSLEYISQGRPRKRK